MSAAWPEPDAEQAAMQDLLDAVQRAHPEERVTSVTIVGEARPAHVAPKPEPKPVERPFVADPWRPPVVDRPLTDREIVYDLAAMVGIVLLALVLATLIDGGPRAW